MFPAVYVGLLECNGESMKYKCHSGSFWDMYIALVTLVVVLNLLSLLELLDVSDF